MGMATLLFSAPSLVSGQCKKITTRTEFKEMIATGLVVVKFYATWCPPCKMLTKTLDHVIPDYTGRVQFVAVDVDQHKDLEQEYGVKSYPTIIFFNNGKIIYKATTLARKSAAELH